MPQPEDAPPASAVPGFWTWLVREDADGDRGIANIINRWLAFHVAVGAALGWASAADPTALAKTIAMPGAAILVGLAFGWAGRSASLMQDKNFSKFLIENGPSPEGYIYSFQLAVLTVLVFIGTALTIAAGEIGVSTGSASYDALINRAFLGLIGSIAVRESWGIIYFVNKLSIQYYRLREHELASEGSSTS